MKKSLFLILSLTYLSLIFSLSFFSRSDLPTKINGAGVNPYLADKPLSEDGFYLLTIAWNIGTGKGIVYNQGISTAGIQPFAAFIYGVIALAVHLFGGDKIFFLRTLLFFSGCLLFLLCYLLYKLMILLSPQISKNKVIIYSMSLSLFNLKVFLQFTNGLETGIYILLIALLFYYSIKIFSGGIRGRKTIILFGILCGVTLTARLDFILLLFCFLVQLYLRRRILLKEFLLIICISLIPLIPWEIYNYIISGSLFQSSVNAQTAMLRNFYPEGIRFFIWAFLQQLVPFIFLGNKYILFISFSSLIFIFLILFRKKWIGGIIQLSGNAIPVSWVISSVALTLVYLLFSSAPYFFFRYFVSLMILTFPFQIKVIDEFVGRMKNGLILLVIICILGWGVQELFYFHSGKLGVHQSLRTAFIKNNFPNEKIGVWQSGVTGYFCDNVFNLDGKINHFALEKIKEGKLLDYIDSRKINVLIEWEARFWELEKKRFTSEWVLFSKDIGDGRTYCYV